MNVRCFLFLALPVLLTAFSESSEINHDPELKAVILKSNEMYLDARFDEGITLLQQYENAYGKSPASSFFIANGFWWKIFRAYVYDKEAKTSPFDGSFESYLNQTITLSEARLSKNNKDIEGLFYLGNAYSLKSRVKGLRGNYYSAGRDAAKGKGYLEQVLEIDPNQYDTLYNLGMYNYLAGALPGYAKVLKFFLFLPGGDKDEGLSQLKLAGEKSTYFASEAQLILARFYADHEDQPLEAIKIVGPRPISLEVFSDEFGEMEEQALEIASWGRNVYVKVPVTNTRREFAGELIRRLARAGVQLNITALMTNQQVKDVLSCLSPETNSIISVFAGRVADTGRDPMPQMKEAVSLLKSNPKAELIWASPRELLNIFHAEAIGCHIITVTNDILAKLPLVGKDLDDYSLDTVKMFFNDAASAGFRIATKKVPSLANL